MSKRIDEIHQLAAEGRESRGRNQTEHEERRLHDVIQRLEKEVVELRETNSKLRAALEVKERTQEGTRRPSRNELSERFEQFRRQFPSRTGFGGGSRGSSSGQRPPQQPAQPSRSRAQPHNEKSSAFEAEALKKALAEKRLLIERMEAMAAEVQEQRKVQEDRLAAVNRQLSEARDQSEKARAEADQARKRAESELNAVIDKMRASQIQAQAIEQRARAAEALEQRARERVRDRERTRREANSEDEGEDRN